MDIMLVELAAEQGEEGGIMKEAEISVMKVTYKAYVQRTIELQNYAAHVYDGYYWEQEAKQAAYVAQGYGMACMDMLKIEMGEERSSNLVLSWQREAIEEM